MHAHLCAEHLPGITVPAISVPNLGAPQSEVNVDELRKVFPYGIPTFEVRQLSLKNTLLLTRSALLASNNH